MDDGGEVGNAPSVLSTMVPGVRVGLGLQQSQVITQKFNQKWKVGRSWLYYYSKPPGGPLAGIMKCSACEEFRTNSVGSRIWGATGCSTIQILAVKMHKKSDDHKFAFTRRRALHFPQSQPSSVCTSIEPGLQVMVDREKAIILIVMKLLYFVVYNDLPLLQYVEQCRIHALLSTPDMPTIVEYSSYTNVIAGMGFLSAIFEHLRESLFSEVKLSPCYSILIDESRDRTCKLHLIVYLCYLSKGGEGAPCIKFIELMPISRGIGEVMFNSI